MDYHGLNARIIATARHSSYRRRLDSEKSRRHVVPNAAKPPDGAIPRPERCKPTQTEAVPEAVPEALPVLRQDWIATPSWVSENSRLHRAVENVHTLFNVSRTRPKPGREIGIRYET